MLPSAINTRGCLPRPVEMDFFQVSQRLSLISLVEYPSSLLFQSLIEQVVSVEL